ncbi:triose-phosphate isomerase [Wohlfahrtiimonas larvae]|uniref:Triosephosphate isomerase n=1 Tax=Wohlfahrtiimonas larvae TaxID=1157986 RepID=A0ABP9MGT1_9GAMM|nr:triose-phosphate isomerase [Wohlfahrtiimonas larvae]
MKKKMIAGNWKMNGDVATALDIIAGITDAANQSQHDVVIAPPFVYLSLAAEKILSSKIQLGAQNLADQEVGAYTGEISAKMLADVGCQYVLVGHSERRQLYGETDLLVAQKTILALENGLVPILCVGETLEERESNQWKDVITTQLLSVVDHCGIDAFKNIIVAYEPVWAIGTGKSASADIANEVHEFIYYTLSCKSDNIRPSLKVLYGGSVTAENSAQYMSQEYIDGVLVGGASLKPSVFSEIIRSVE